MPHGVGCRVTRGGRTIGKSHSEGGRRACAQHRASAGAGASTHRAFPQRHWWRAVGAMPGASRGRGGKPASTCTDRAVAAGPGAPRKRLSPAIRCAVYQRKRLGRAAPDAGRHGRERRMAGRIDARKDARKLAAVVETGLGLTPVRGARRGRRRRHRRPRRLVTAAPRAEERGATARVTSSAALRETRECPPFSARARYRPPSSPLSRQPDGMRRAVTSGSARRAGR